MKPKTDLYCEYPKNEFSKKQWEHFRDNGIGPAINQSRSKHDKLHLVLAEWDKFCEYLGNVHGWDAEVTNKALILDNLVSGNLVMDWVNLCRDEQIGYTDDNIQPGDVIWGIEWTEFSHFVGRVKIIVRLEGLLNIKDRRGRLLESSEGSENIEIFFMTNLWSEVREKIFAKCKNDLHAYLDATPKMLENDEARTLITAGNILQRVHYRHAHVHMPDEIWDIVWKDGMTNWNARHVKKREIDFQEWKENTRFWYRFGMEKAKIEDIQSFPWCGTRHECLKHHVFECLPCRSVGRPFKPVYHCVDDGVFWVYGIPQGHINKWNMNGSWKR